MQQCKPNYSQYLKLNKISYLAFRYLSSRSPGLCISESLKVWVRKSGRNICFHLSSLSVFRDTRNCQIERKISNKVLAVNMQILN